jgi:pimeloyl-ACP methyl ester carboxylesterase
MAPRPIFIHGSGGGIESWELQEPRFDGSMVIGLPGHPVGAPLRTVGGYAEWVGAAIADVPGPNVLVGHSLGGAIALQVALNEPELVAGLVLVGTGAQIPVPPALASAARSDVTTEARRLLTRGWHQIEPATLDEESARIVRIGGETLAMDYEACAAWNVMDRLQEITLTTMVVVGDEDRLTPPIRSEELVRGIQGAILARVPNAAHWVMKEQPETFSRMLAGFLSRVELLGE